MIYSVNLLRYGLVYFITAIGLAIVLAVLASVVDLDVGGIPSTILPVMIAAMVEGQKRAQAG